MRLLKQLLTNPVEIWSREHFREPIVVNATALGHRIIVSDPDAIKRVLVDNASNYVRDDLQRRLLMRTTGHSLFSAEGEAWRRQRRLLAPLFTRSRLADYAPAMAAAATAATARLAGVYRSSADISAAMAVTTLDVLNRTILSNAIELEDLAVVACNIRRYADGSGAISMADLLGLPAWIPGLRRMRAISATRTVAKRAREIVSRRRQATEAEGCPLADDLVSLMLATRDQKTRESMSDREVEDNVSTFLGAGSDTVAGALTWSLYLLTQSPEFRAVAEQEVDEVVGDGSVTLDLVERLPFTRAVIEEAMRLYPPAPLLSRAALQDDELCGRRIPAGSVVIIAPWLVHRHQRLWDDPLVFDPRRFLPGRREKIRRFSYLPFGAGPRICIGMQFAMQEAVILLAHLLSSLRFTLVPGIPVRVFQCVTLQPKGGLAMTLERRQAR